MTLIWILASQSEWQKAQWGLWYGALVEAVCCHRWSLVLYVLGRDLYQTIRFVFGGCDKVGYEWFDFVFWFLKSFDKWYFLLSLGLWIRNVILCLFWTIISMLRVRRSFSYDMCSFFWCCKFKGVIFFFENTDKTILKWMEFYIFENKVFL